MRNVDVYVVHRSTACLEDPLGGMNHDTRRELENLSAVHLHVAAGAVELARAAAGEPQVLAAAAVRAELEAEEAALLDRLEHDCARAVAEQHDRRAVGPVEDLREHVASDDE